MLLNNKFKLILPNTTMHQSQSKKRNDKSTLQKQFDDAQAELTHLRNVISSFQNRDSELHKLVSKHETELEQLEEEHEKMFDKLEERHEKEVDKLSTRHELEIEEIEARHEREVESVQSKYETVLSAYDMYESEDEPEDEEHIEIVSEKTGSRKKSKK